jgi:trigger factor
MDNDKILITEREPCILSVRYTGDAEEILNKRAQVLEQFKRAPVPGNRVGKASMDAIRMHYRNQIEEALKRALAEHSYHETVFEKKLRVHGAPKINSFTLHLSSFTCEFEVHTKPDFELANFRGLEIPKPHNQLNTDHITEAMLQDIRTQLGDVIPYTEDDFVQAGDNVILDYTGTVDGQKVEGLSSEGEMLAIGKSSLPEFDNNLLGMKMGDTREFDMQIPDTGLPSVAGKTVHIRATVNMGSKTVPAPLDDVLAQKLGKKDYAELREYVFGLAAAKAAHASQMNINDAVAHRLLADNTIPIPPWMSLSEAQYLVHQAKLDWNTLSNEDKQSYITMSEQNCKLSLILDKIREDEPLAQLTDQETFDIVKQNLAHSKTNSNLDDVIKEMQRTGYLAVLMSRIRDEFALDFCVKSAKILE